MKLQFLKNTPYFIAALLLFLAMSLTACAGTGAGGGGEGAPESPDEPFPGVPEEPFPGTDGETFPSITEEPSPGMTEEPLPGMTEEPSPGMTEEPSPGMTEEPPTSEETLQTGTIESVDLEARRISLLLDTGETMEVNVDEFLTQVTINGASGTLQDLQPGDLVEVEIDQVINVATSITVVAGAGGGA